MEIKVPTVSIIIGEGGSGGAIALASSNRVLMLENAIYSVISPEGCATILWRDPSKTLQAAEAMKLSADDLLNLGVVDEVISEPVGGAHRNREEMVKNVKLSLEKNLYDLLKMDREQIFQDRNNKFLNIGRQKGFQGKIKNSNNLVMKNNLYYDYSSLLKKYRLPIILVLIFLLVIFLL